MSKNISIGRNKTDVRSSVISVAKAAGYSTRDVQPFRARLFAQLSGTENSFTFVLGKKDGGGVLDIEQLLMDNDALLVHSMGLKVIKADFANGKSSGLQAVSYPYPDKGIFSATGQTKALEGLYNSKIAIWTDQINRAELNGSMFRSAPRTQFATGTNPSVDGLDLVDIVGTVLFHGRQDNKIVLSMPRSLAAINTTDPATDAYCNFAEITLDGFVIKNGATDDKFFEAFEAFVESSY